MTTLPLRLSAQKEWVIRGDCTPVDSLSSLLMGGSDSSPKQGRTGGVRRLPSPKTQWDSTKVYRQLVILLSFRDVDFKMENPQAIYDSIFNYNGYNQDLGKGCVAEYFRDQSNGLFNLSFDVYGPVKVDTLACPYSSPDDKTRNYGKDQFSTASKAISHSILISTTNSTTGTAMALSSRLSLSMPASAEIRVVAVTATSGPIPARSVH